MSAQTAFTNIYKRRWEIETLFKRIKQNYALRDFPGDNGDAIRLHLMAYVNLWRFLDQPERTLVQERYVPPSLFPT